MKNDFIEIESKKIPLSDIKSYEIKTEQVQQTWTEKRKRNWFVLTDSVKRCKRAKSGIISNPIRMNWILFIY